MVAYIKLALAGRAAEELLIGSGSSTSVVDQRQATDRASAMVRDESQSSCSRELLVENIRPTSLILLNNPSNLTLENMKHLKMLEIF